MVAYELGMQKPKTIKAARAAKELTLSEVAQAAGCDISTIHRHEKAGTWPARARIRRLLMQVLGVTSKATP